MLPPSSFPGDSTGNDNLDADLLERYFAGEGTDEEHARVRHYLAEHAEIRMALEAYLEYLTGPLDVEPPDPSASFARLMARARADDVRPLPSIVRERGLDRRPGYHAWPHRRSAGWIVAAAAAGAFAAGIGALVYSRSPAAVPTPPAHVYVTGRGERAHLELSDGTIVDMAPGSRLRVANGYGDARRDVALDGEAFFSVVHDARHPFTVYTASSVTRDVGTAFAVRNYAQDHDERVVVRAGRVSLSGVGMLTAGDVARRGADGRVRIEHHASVDELLGWLRGDFTYHNANLSTVVRDLSRWYGIDVTVADPAIDTLTFTGSLTGMRSRDALDLVAATANLRVSHVRAHYVLAPK